MATKKVWFTVVVDIAYEVPEGSEAPTMEYVNENIEQCVSSSAVGPDDWETLHIERKE